MGDTFVISGLIQKRAEILGLAIDLENRAKHMRADLVHIDAAILLFDPDANLSAIKARQPPLAGTSFAPGEKARRIREALRVATEPLSADDIVGPLMVEKGLDPANAKLRGRLIQAVLNTLGNMRARGHVQKIGHGFGARWTAPADE